MTITRTMTRMMARMTARMTMTRMGAYNQGGNLAQSTFVLGGRAYFSRKPS